MILYQTFSRLLAVLFAASPSRQTTFFEEPSRSTVASLINQAKCYIEEKKVDDAFQTLAHAYAVDPSANGLQGAFELCLRLRISLANEEEDGIAEEAGTTSIGLLQDRLGLASLLVDQERYEEASSELRAIVSGKTNSFKEPTDSNADDDVRQDVLDKASAMLYRVDAAACRWDDLERESDELLSSLRRNGSGKHSRNFRLPPVHPFEALKWPCISLEDATYIAGQYSARAELSLKRGVGGNSKDVSDMSDLDCIDMLDSPISVFNSRDRNDVERSQIIRIGYITPDFTGKHPLAFLMQDVFRLHDRSRFRVHLYSLAKDDGSEEVKKVKSGADKWIELNPGLSSDEIAAEVRADDLDIMIDLCGHAGTMTVSEVMARRVAPLQISYMGFPGSSGSEFIDFLLCDETVVPFSVPNIRRHYKERLILMPHCYFVNSHKSAAKCSILSSHTEKSDKRVMHGLPARAFVFCCHSRPDKIDPTTFRTWVGALSKVRSGAEQGLMRDGKDAVLWLLRSGQEMEDNLRRIARDEYGLDDDALVFAEIAPRPKHLERLALADVFLDTPAYNAHTLGCDALYAGVPMISLLRSDLGIDAESCGMRGTKEEAVLTEKWASRVGASLLKACGLDDLVTRTMLSYEELMIRCALDQKWFRSVQDRLVENRDSCALFDTARWVSNMEIGLAEAFRQCADTKQRHDIVVQDLQH